MPFTKLFAPILKSAIAEIALFEDHLSVVDLITEYSTCQAKRCEDDYPDNCDEEGCGCHGWMWHHPKNDYEDFLSCHDCGEDDPDCICNAGSREDSYCVHEENCNPGPGDNCSCGLWNKFTCVIHGFIHAKNYNLAETYEDWVKYTKEHELVEHNFTYMDCLSDEDDEYDKKEQECVVNYCSIHKKKDGKYETIKHDGKKLVCECKRCRINFRIAKRKRKRKREAKAKAKAKAKAM
jgi:hypothetical protein